MDMDVDGSSESTSPPSSPALSIPVRARSVDCINGVVSDNDSSVCEGSESGHVNANCLSLSLSLSSSVDGGRSMTPLSTAESLSKPRSNSMTLVSSPLRLAQSVGTTRRPSSPLIINSLGPERSRSRPSKRNNTPYSRRRSSLPSTSLSPSPSTSRVRLLQRDSSAGAHMAKEVASERELTTTRATSMELAAMLNNGFTIGDSQLTNSSSGVCYPAATDGSGSGNHCFSSDSINHYGPLKPPSPQLQSFNHRSVQGMSPVISPPLLSSSARVTSDNGSSPYVLQQQSVQRLSP